VTEHQRRDLESCRRGRALVGRPGQALARRLLPNKRLKLPGGDRLKGGGVFAPLTRRGLSSTTLALAGESPAA